MYIYIYWREMPCPMLQRWWQRRISISISHRSSSWCVAISAINWRTMLALLSTDNISSYLTLLLPLHLSSTLLYRYSVHSSLPWWRRPFLLGGNINKRELNNQSKRRHSAIAKPWIIVLLLFTAIETQAQSPSIYLHIAIHIALVPREL